MNLWDSVKERALQGANVAKIEVQKTKVRGEIFLIDREIKARQQTFGVDLYNFVAPLASGQEFFASDDRLTTTLRPPLLKAQREIAALDIKHKKIKREIELAAAKRQASFPTPATTFGEKVVNAGKSTALGANEAKLATELAMVDTQIKAHKQDFGLELYNVLVDLEDKQGWLATDRNIRSMYDQTRKDVETIEKRKTAKEKELEALGGSATTTAGSATPAQAKSLQATLNWSAATGAMMHQNNNNSNHSSNGGFVPPAPTAAPRAVAPVATSQPPPPMAQAVVLGPAASAGPMGGAAPSAPAVPFNPMFSFPSPAAPAAPAPPPSTSNVSGTTDMFANTNFFNGQDPFAAAPSSAYSAPVTMNDPNDPFASLAAASTPFSPPPPPPPSSSHPNRNPNQQQDLLDFL